MIDGQRMPGVPYGPSSGLAYKASSRLELADPDMDEYAWELRRNCSLTPRQLGVAFLLVCTLSFGVAGAFALAGAWMVLGYALLEVAAVGAALLHYARHATDYERLTLTRRCLLVERSVGGRVTRVRLARRGLEIAAPAGPHDLIVLAGPEARVGVGRYVDMARRLRVAHELRLLVFGCC